VCAMALGYQLCGPDCQYPQISFYHARTHQLLDSDREGRDRHPRAASGVWVGLDCSLETRYIHCILLSVKELFSHFKHCPIHDTLVVLYLTTVITSVANHWSWRMWSCTVGSQLSKHVGTKGGSDNDMSR